MAIINIDDLHLATVKINTRNSNGDLGSGTGFIVDFAEGLGGEYTRIPLIVTNKHVVQGAIEGTVQFHASTKEGTPAGQCKFTIDNFEKYFHIHPSEEVDLCAMAIAPFFLLAAKDKIKPYYKSLSLEQVMDETGLQNFSASQEIIVVGYPNGIWDEVNNLPIFRKGILGTLPSFNYQGKQEFLIDCAIYPGSSGSPVLALEPLFNPKTMEMVTSIKLLGVVYATYQHTAQGTLVIENIPANFVNTMVPNHLGLVLKSTRLLELNELIKEYYIGTEAFDPKSEEFHPIKE
ncbi:serine protease [Priestia megaterium]|uniref:S1 family peptidase n=1 Tax=Priestia megaterium TaxID=1404 RepID=UPI000BF951E3|nr:serine protease [Priestia megaterium]PFO12702.1 serine protease [Priestia megaterium]